MLKINAHKDPQKIVAMGNPTRLKILTTLTEGEQSISELAEKLKIPQPTVTVAVQKLETAGLVNSRTTAGLRGVKKIVSLRDDEIIVDLKKPEQ